ncbi:hypothetical protein [uncultured Proteiniphilum sp.]|uniref:hypothetical protein n=1 Tax=uncultured Proteiniphilum sp. TaxID=497637 RepID=UPI0026322B7A|nr:hypothetical protein [uncultured Proteiniphilum sp.]
MMSTVIFDSPFNKNTFVRSNKVFWDYSWWKRKKQLIHWSGLSITFLGLGIWTGIRSNEPGNPYIFVGVAFCCLTILGGLEMVFSRRKQKKRIQETADEYEKANSEHIIKISEDGVELLDFQSHIVLKWSVFKYYTIYKEYIILIPKNYIAGGLLIDKNTHGLPKYNQALTILEDKLREV